MEYFLSFSKYSVENILNKCQKLMNAFDREIGPDAENAVHFIKINISDFLTNELFKFK